MCGVFGIYKHSDAKRLISIGLFNLKHRGKNGAGIAGKDSLRMVIDRFRDLGPVQSILGPSNEGLKRIKGDSFIGHVRYPTAGKDSLENVQPQESSSIKGKFFLASNGDVVNFSEQKSFLERENIRIYSDNDAEMIAASFSWQVSIKGRNIIEAAQKVARHVKGSYATVFFTDFDDNMYALRDPMGIRPLVMGEKDGSPVFASETCALDAIGAIYIRDVMPGELIVAHQNGISSHRVADNKTPAFCIFELVYFARPDSIWQNSSCEHYRESMGQMLAQEHYVEADVVVAIPKSGIPGAVGYSRESNIPYGIAVIENPSPLITLESGQDIDRTFIGATIQQINAEADDKYNIIADRVAGKKVIIIDDSIVRGTTAYRLTRNLRMAGAKEVHWRIPCPPIPYSCFYGIATKEKRLLAAREGDIELVRKRIGDPDSLCFLSLEGLIKSTNCCLDCFCTACFNGNYPIPIPDNRL